MKTKNFYYLLLMYILMYIVVFQSCAQNGKNKISNASEIKNEKAIQTLKEFYTLYISACDSSDGNSALDSLKNKYFTVSLLNKLKNPNLELDADPILNAQDCDKNCVKTLEIKPDAGQKNVYNVCYTWLSDDTKVYIKLLLVENNGNYLIDDILSDR